MQAFGDRPADFANGIQAVFVRLGVPEADDEAGPGSTSGHLRRRLPAERSTEPRKADPDRSDAAGRPRCGRDVLRLAPARYADPPPHPCA
jgi:hypothetical protein